MSVRPQKYCGRSDGPFLPRTYSLVGKTDKKGTCGKCYVPSLRSAGRCEGTLKGTVDNSTLLGSAVCFVSHSHPSFVFIVLAKGPKVPAPL